MKWLSRIALILAMATAVMALGTRSTHADERDFQIINGSAKFVVHFYVAPSAPDDDWGDDILGVDVLGPGESGSILFNRFQPDMCTYDLRAVFDDASEVILLNIDLCSTVTVTVGT